MNKYKLAEKFLGLPLYFNIINPIHLIVLDAIVYIKNQQMIWHGDLDITTDEEKIKALARRLGETVYILKGRYDGTKSKSIEDEAVYVTDGSKMPHMPNCKIKGYQHVNGKLIYVPFQEEK